MGKEKDGGMRETVRKKRVQIDKQRDRNKREWQRGEEKRKQHETCEGIFAMNN